MTESGQPHPLAAKISAASAAPQGEFAVAKVISELISQTTSQTRSPGDDLENLFVEAINPLLQERLQGTQLLLDWFSEQGFGGPHEQVTAAHSDLNFVLTYRQGIPISLGIVLIESARRLGMTALGINFPGHFLVRIDEQVIDPVGMDILLPQHLKQMTQHMESPLHAILQPATPQMIALRMLNNLKALHASVGDFVAVLEVMDLQLSVVDEQAEMLASLHFERGEYWQKLGAVGAARDAYHKCAQISVYPQLTRKAQQLADKLDGTDETLH